MYVPQEGSEQSGPVRSDGVARSVDKGLDVVSGDLSLAIV
jgi:hypothetical protein